MFLGSNRTYLYMRMYVHIRERDFCPSVHKHSPRIIYDGHVYMYRLWLTTVEHPHWWCLVMLLRGASSGVCAFPFRRGSEEHSCSTRCSAFLWKEHFLLDRIKLFLFKKSKSHGCFARMLPCEHLQLEPWSGPVGASSIS